MSDEGRARARRLAAGWERRFYSELWVDEIEAALTAARAEGEAAGRAAEREACAKVADLHVDGAHPDDCIGCRTARGIAAAIRARKEG